MSPARSGSLTMGVSWEGGVTGLETMMETLGLWRNVKRKTSRIMHKADRKEEGEPRKTIWRSKKGKRQSRHFLPISTRTDAPQT